MNGDRRHRIHGVELDFVKEDVRWDTHRRVRERDNFEATSLLFRVLWRFEYQRQLTSEAKYLEREVDNKDKRRHRH